MNSLTTAGRPTRLAPVDADDEQVNTSEESTDAAQPVLPHGFLRCRLKESSPALHHALERSWSIALNEWIPAVPPSMDSFNSYPHLRNVEHHIEQVIAEAESSGSRCVGLGLRPVEIYVLLASILFHDLGRSMKGKSHPILSAEGIIRDYGVLGIPSIELARSISAISLAHDPPPKWTPNSLCDTVIDPYGEVRQRLLRALLLLGDHMDGSSRRTLPPYVKHSSKLETIGLFRRVVQGVYADCETQHVRVALSDMVPWHDGTATGRTSIGFAPRYSFPAKTKAELLELEHFRNCPAAVNEIHTHYVELEAARIDNMRLRRTPANARLRSTRSTPPTPEEESTWVLQILEKLQGSPVKHVGAAADPFGPILPHAARHAPLSLWEFLECIPDRPPIWARSDIVPLCDRLSVLDWLVALGWLHVRLETPAKQGDLEPDPWPHRSLLAVLMHDSSENHQALQTVRQDLAGAQIRLRSWLLEHREHLYTHYGLESYEPVFPAGFLERIVSAMWKLSVTMFGFSRFTYGELASEALEPNLLLVQRAVRRVSIVERCERYSCDDPNDHEKRPTQAIWAGRHEWRWVLRHRLTEQCGNCANQMSCWRGDLRKKAETMREPGLDYLLQLVGQLQSPLI